MHEAALAAPLLSLVLEECDRHGRERGTALKVTRIRVRAGLLMAVEAATLTGIFALMAEGTPARDAELVIETEPMRGTCPDCAVTGHADMSTATRNFRCPRCNGENVSWHGGNELYIAAIAVEPAGDTSDKET